MAKGMSTVEMFRRKDYEFVLIGINPGYTEGQDLNEAIREKKKNLDIIVLTMDSEQKIPRKRSSIIYFEIPISQAIVRRPPQFVYKRRKPETTVIYQMLQEHLETFLARVDGNSQGARWPGFVKLELDAFMDCGVLANEIESLRCPVCCKTILSTLLQDQAVFLLRTEAHASLCREGHWRHPSICASSLSDLLHPRGNPRGFASR